jgi:hypothetical protein
VSSKTVEKDVLIWEGSLSGGVPATGGSDTVPVIDAPYQILVLLDACKLRALSPSV